MPSAGTYVRRYRRTFGKTPGVWGSFTYDSAKILFAALNRAKSYRVGTVEKVLRRTKGYRGAGPVPDTCLALLFLRRANLAPGLTRQVEFLRVK